MSDLKSILTDKRTHDEVRKALVAAGRHAGHGVQVVSRTGWRLARKTARGVSKHIRVRRERRLHEAVQVVSPFDGDPVTRMVRSSDGGVAAIMIEPTVLTPVRAKWADFLGNASAFVLAALSLGLVALIQDPAIYLWPIAFVWPWPFMGLLRKAWRRRLRKHSVLMFTPEHFSVREGNVRPVVYDRQEPHRFRLDNRHEKARREAEQHEIVQASAQMQGNVIRKTKYHRETLHLMIDHRGQPRKVMEIMGQDDALLVLARVKAVDEVMDQLMAMGDVQVKGPQSEWDDMPGKIPEEV